MAPIETIFIITLAFGAAIAVVASLRVMKERENLGRTIAQLSFVWLFPVIGPLVTMQLLRKESERGAGEYASDSPPLADSERLNLRDATFETTRSRRLGDAESADAGPD